ncbi:MAG: 4-alpha-glucanotransferase [Mycobacteriales bacterium]
MTLSELAAAHGVSTSYVDWRGRSVEVPRTAVVAVLAALGVDAGSDEAVADGLRAVAEARWAPGLPQCVVVRPGGGVDVVAADSPRLRVRTEDGDVVEVDRAVEREREGRLARWLVPLPDLPLGYHRLQLGDQECPLVVVPDRLPLHEERHWGWQVQLYALRSAGSWGVGDYADLRTVATHAAADGAGAVLVNPLHAETPVLPLEASPYSPSSRLFRSALALRLEDAPEWTSDLARLRPPTDPERVDRDTAWAAKRAALEQMWPRHRADALAAFRAERGEPLERFATFCALAEEHGLPWQDWPEGLVADPDRVAFWCWVQLLVDEQLAGIGEDLAVGVVHDLAVGVDAGGADAWALQDVLAQGVSLGAPPDGFNQLGQDWGLPPWHPSRLRARGYEPYRQLVQNVLRHAGGIRVDHVIGLSRMWWVPQGAGAGEGTYVRYDPEALLGILALEATRAGAVVVGEDLGTVEPAMRELLDRTGVLGSTVLWFETTDDGWYLPPSHWRRASLASVTTHDLPTAAGWLAEEHLRIRSELHQLAQPLEVEQAQARQAREMLLAMLRHEGLLGEADDGSGELVLALHRALVASPCRLVMASYADAVGDLRQPNLPGTVDEYPNWRLPVADADGKALGLEELLAHPGVRRLTELLQKVG